MVHTPWYPPSRRARSTLLVSLNVTYSPSRSLIVTDPSLSVTYSHRASPELTSFGLPVCSSSGIVMYNVPQYSR